MHAEQDSVERYPAFLIHSAEMQQHPLLPEAVRKPEIFPVMEILPWSQYLSGAGEVRFRREGNQNPAVIPRCIRRCADAVIPFPVQIQITVSHKIRAGIFLPYILPVRNTAPPGPQLLHGDSPRFCFLFRDIILPQTHRQYYFIFIPGIFQPGLYLFPGDYVILNVISVFRQFCFRMNRKGHIRKSCQWRIQL